MAQRGDNMGRLAEAMYETRDSLENDPPPSRALGDGEVGGTKRVCSTWWSSLIY